MNNIFKQNAFYILLFPVSLFFLLFSLIAPYSVAEKIASGTSLYGFPLKYLNDFSLYVYDIKLGQEGKILWKNPFSEEYYPEFILQPHYPIIGMLSIPFRLTPYETYAIARIVAYVIITTFVYLFFYFAFSNQSGKVLAFILFLSSTSIWQITQYQGLERIQDPVTYSNWFNVFLRNTMLPPHHLLAIFLFFVILLRIVYTKKKILNYIVTAGISFCLAFVHPYIAKYILFIIATYCLLELLIKRKIPKQLYLHAILIASVTVPVIVYHGWTLVAIFKEPLHIKGTIEATKPFLPIIDYLKALGFILVPASISILFKKSWNTPISRILLIWAYLPIFLFYIPHILPLPTSNVRIFQLYQIIPLSYLAAKAIEYISLRIRIPLWFLPLIIGIASVTYALPSYILEYRYHTSSKQPYFTYTTAMQRMQLVYPILNNQTEPQSVVMAPEIVSLLIPANTHNFVILGHNNRDLDRKTAELRYFFEGGIPLEMLENFLLNYRVSYIIFGIETKSFKELPYSNSPILEVVFDQDGTTLVKVNANNSRIKY